MTTSIRKLTDRHLAKKGVPAPATIWHRADLHLHTTYSDGLMTPEETVEIIAADRRLEVMAITDHDTTEGAFIAQAYARKNCPQLEVVIGQEVTTGDGDVVGLFLNGSLPYFETAAAAVEAIHRQGGLAVAVHPFAFGWDLSSVTTAILHLPFDAVEAWHGCPFSIPGNLLTLVLNRLGQRLPILGNSDSHIPYTAGQSFTWFPGQNSADLRRAIVANDVFPGGSTWKLADLWRNLVVIRERGWPEYTPAPHPARYSSE